MLQHTLLLKILRSVNCFLSFFESNECFYLSKNLSRSKELLSSTTVSSIDNINQYIRMISEGSCDSEAWSDDAENSALHYRNKLQFKVY